MEKCQMIIKLKRWMEARSIRRQLQRIYDGQAGIKAKLANLNAAREATNAADAEMHLTIADNLVRTIQHNESVRQKLADNLVMSTRHSETLNIIVVEKLDEIQATLEELKKE